MTTMDADDADDGVRVRVAIVRDERALGVALDDHAAGADDGADDGGSVNRRRILVADTAVACRAAIDCNGHFDVILAVHRALPTSTRDLLARLHVTRTVVNE